MPLVVAAPAVRYAAAAGGQPRRSGGGTQTAGSSASAVVHAGSGSLRTSARPPAAPDLLNQGAGAPSSPPPPQPSTATRALPNGHVSWPREAMSARPNAEASTLHLSHNRAVCIIRVSLSLRGEGRG